jgi:sensor histidine kinase regulating citrate/malate metabolism
MGKKVKLKRKLMRVSIFLIALFTATVFIVTNSNMNNLVEENESAKLDCISNMGMDIIKSKYDGDWNVKDGKLFIGETLINNNFEVVDVIREKTGSLATIYVGDEGVSTSVQDKDGRRTVGFRVPDEAAQSVLKKGVAYKGTENILGGKYNVKYVPIKDSEGKAIGVWFVGVPKSYVGSQGNKILQMSASIVVISIICGILGCLILMLYSKRYLKDIDTLKVSFLGSNPDNNKIQRKVLRMSALLIGTFVVIWVTIQGFTIGNVVNKLVDNDIKDKLNVSSELGYMLINERYKGDWSVQEDKLLKGINSLNDNSEIVDRIGSVTGLLSTIFMNSKRISTNILKADGTRPIGTGASNEVIETVLKDGREYIRETVDVDKRCITRYTPLKDSSGKVIGMWFLGVDKKFASNQIIALRRPITQISLLAIIMAFIAFLVLSRRMVSDVGNYDVKLSA